MRRFRSSTRANQRSGGGWNSEAPEAEGDTEVVEFLTFDTPAQPEVPNEAEATDEALMEFLLETDSDASPFDPDQDPLNESTAS